MLRWKSPVEWFISIGFGGILIWAAIDKVLHPLFFAESISNYRVIGPSLSLWGAAWLPHLEWILGVFIVSHIWPKTSALLNTILMSLFWLLIFQALIRGLDIECGCFGNENHRIGLLKMLENTLLVSFSLILLWLRKHHRS